MKTEMTVGVKNKYERLCPSKLCDNTEYAVCHMFEQDGFKASLPKHGMQPGYDVKIEHDGLIEYVQVKSKTDKAYHADFGRSLVEGEIAKEFDWLVTIKYDNVVDDNAVDDDVVPYTTRASMIFHEDLELNYNEIQDRGEDIPKSRIGAALLDKLGAEMAGSKVIEKFQKSLDFIQAMTLPELHDWVEKHRV